MKILIVDDSKAMRMIVTRTLRQAGYGDHTFVEAVDGADGLAKVASEAPDLVLSDWNMPEVTGIEFLRALRGERQRRPLRLRHLRVDRRHAGHRRAGRCAVPHRQAVHAPRPSPSSWAPSSSSPAAGPDGWSRPAGG